MSILITGMEIPPVGTGKVIMIDSDGDVWAVGKDECTIITGAKAVSVPPHGRLIDADALIKGHFSDEHRIAMSYANKCWMRRIINGEPTIIPAREEGTKTEEDSEPWLCLSCRHYPPSSTDGKPCSQCNPSEVFHSCYDPAEEGE